MSRHLKENAAAIFDGRQITMEMTSSLDPITIVPFLDGWCLSEPTVTSIQNACRTNRFEGVRELKSGIKQYLLTLDESQTNVRDALKHVIDAFEQASAGQCIVNLLRGELDTLTASPPQAGQATGATAATTGGGSGILVTGGLLGFGIQKLPPEVYSLTSNTSHSLDIAMNPWVDHVSGVLRDGRVMLAGGISRGSMTEILDPVSKQVTPGPGMTAVRRAASSAMCNGDFYVTGGEDEFRNIFKSCEVFRDGRWKSISDMKEARRSHASVAVDKSIYSICGQAYGWLWGENTLNSVEHYSTETNTWETVAPTNHGRWGLSAAQLNGCIYACGGSDQTFKIFPICERYDPQTDRWERVADMCEGRSGFCLVAAEGKLYAMGGFGNDVGASVECYDAAMDKWEKVGHLIESRVQSSAVVVDCC